jgi:DNA-binding response OmpR family regulator
MTKQRILVADDDRSIVKIGRGYLEQARYEVQPAYDGETALHLLRSAKPDLLVLDLMLPDRDGWEITRIIRSDATLGTLPIIMLTARVEDVDKIVGLEVGAALDHVYELDDEQIANLYEQTRHLIRLVNELRELALAEAAQLPLDKEVVDLTQLVHETVLVFEPLAEEKEVKLTAHLAPALPTVLADRSRLRQVLHNLLANALRHTPASGAVVISAHGVGQSGHPGGARQWGWP